jgi:hypothetical protein
MNILAKQTVEKLREQASSEQPSLEADLEVIFEETEQSKTWRERTRRIADEIRQSGQKFPDTTELLREDRER